MDPRLLLLAATLWQPAAGVDHYGDPLPKGGPATGITTAAVTHFHSPGRAACFGWGDAGSVRCSEPTILRPDRAVIFVVSLRLLE